MGKRPLSKKELEEQRKKEQEQAAAQVNDAVYCYLLLTYDLTLSCNYNYLLCAGI